MSTDPVALRDDPSEEIENRFAAHIVGMSKIKERLMAGRNQTVMGLVFIELINCWRHRIKASPLRATVDYSERISTLQHDT